MRSPRLAFIPSLAFILATVPASRAAAETVRTVRAELSGQDLSHFAVENLLGTMRISVGAGDSVAAVATIHAESAALADAVRIERVAGDGGAATLRVQYPYDRVSTFRYREPSDDGDELFFGWASGSTYRYDGHRVRVSPGRGSRLYTDLEIQVPAGRLRASFRNLVGLVEAEGLQGQLRFEVASADLTLRRLDGDIALNGASGDTRARDIRGTWKSDFSSGDCMIDGFDGESLSLSASSGDFVLKHVKARRVEIESSSGDSRLMNRISRNSRPRPPPATSRSRPSARACARFGSGPRAGTYHSGFPPTRPSTLTRSSRAVTWMSASPTGPPGGGGKTSLATVTASAAPASA